mmetsp:Transcript_2096/g.2206  ORF Transcript_2096/g.2206 Transcript_2096/m.2206 type:complete len:220 (-) Transcript_2096:643-1302(-)
MNRSEFPIFQGQRFVCGPPFQDSKECLKLRRIDPSYVLCYKCCLCKSIHRAENKKETGTNVRAVTVPLKSITSFFQRSKSKTMPERTPVLPYYIHPIRPLSARPRETIRISFNKFIPKPLQSSNSSKSLIHPMTARTDTETAPSSSRPSVLISPKTALQLNMERPKSMERPRSRPPSADQISICLRDEAQATRYSRGLSKPYASRITPTNEKITRAFTG